MRKSVNLPAFITFTGVDEQTDIREMALLTRDYPVEWGILFSPKRQGIDARYPSLDFVEHLFKTWPAIVNSRFSAHLCGGHVREVEAMSMSHGIDTLVHDNFGRAQLNGALLPAATEVRKWALRMNVEPIMQCRHEFPIDDRCVSWLFDASGGRGISPTEWPKPPKRRDKVGYAGGIWPGNATAAVEAIGAMAWNYWIDMESGVRDEADRFDLKRCRAVCAAVYGMRK